MRTTLKIMNSTINPYLPVNPVAKLAGAAGILMRRMLAAVGISSHSPLQLEFERIVEQFSPMISRVCFSFAGKATTFEDLQQDALVNIWRGLPNYRGESKLSSWIYRITLNTCVSSVRNFSPSDAPYMPIEALADTENAPDKRERKEELEYLHWLISRLNPIDRSIVLMWLDEFSYDEIAEVIGMPRNSVAVRLHRAKEKLKALSDNEFKK